MRDPVVVTATLPRFLLHGRQEHAQRSISTMSKARPAIIEVAIAGDGPFSLAEADKTIALDAKKRAGLSLPDRGKRRRRRHGDGSVSPVPEIFARKRQYALEVKPATQILARRTVKPLEPGQTLTLIGELFADLVPGTGSLALSVTPSAALDVATPARGARPLSARLHRADRQPRAAAALRQ